MIIAFDPRGEKVIIYIFQSIFESEDRKYILYLTISLVQTHYNLLMDVEMKCIQAIMPLLQLPLRSLTMGHVDLPAIQEFHNHLKPPAAASAVNALCYCLLISSFPISAGVQGNVDHKIGEAVQVSRVPFDQIVCVKSRSKAATQHRV